jgi:hypothetical protein
VEILLVVVFHLNFQVLFLNKVSDSLVVEAFLMEAFRFKVGILFQVVLSLLLLQIIASLQDSVVNTDKVLASI